MKFFSGNFPIGIAVMLLTAISIFSACNTDNDSGEDPPAYSIGDTGPAGGFIFHVAGSAGSYTYYEAAPEDCEMAAWGLAGTVIETSQDIGTGKANTAVMLAANPAEGTAAKLCDAYSSGGKDDWFLPSHGELKTMLLNLHLKGKGGFASEKYWSSTIQGPANYASAVDFNATTGALISTGRSTSCNVRPVRSFN